MKILKQSGTSRQESILKMEMIESHKNSKYYYIWSEFLKAELFSFNSNYTNEWQNNDPFNQIGTKCKRL